jgi:hypothetical protein
MTSWLVHEFIATWQLYYSARDTYGPLVGVSPSDPLGPSFWHNVTEAFTVNDTAFQEFNTFLTRGLDVGQCDASCKQNTICNLRALRAENNCVSRRLSFPAAKRLNLFFFPSRMFPHLVSSSKEISKVWRLIYLMMTNVREEVLATSFRNWRIDSPPIL